MVELHNLLDEEPRFPRDDTRANDPELDEVRSDSMLVRLSYATLIRALHRTDRDKYSFRGSTSAVSSRSCSNK